MLNPQTRDLALLLQQESAGPLHTLTLVEARREYARRRRWQPNAPSVAHVHSLRFEGPAGPVALRLYRPLRSDTSQVLPGLVFFHGGGWVLGDLDSHDTLCRELANGAECMVVAVDYRLAPEHRFPAAVDDAVAAVRWIRNHAESLGIDPTRLAVGGDSAGGNLAAVSALSLRDAGDPPLVFQLLIYPVTDARRGSESYRSLGQGYGLTVDTMRWFCAQYLEDASQETDWRASPLVHADLSGLPPAFILTAGYDPLRDEGLQYSQKLTEADTPSSLVNFERQIHGFITMGRVIDEAKVAVQLCASQLREALSTSHTYRQTPVDPQFIPSRRPS